MDNMKKWDKVTLLVGSATLVCWVIFRFFTKSINFDLVGQQLLARQWLEGNVEGSVIGPTNYILKILFLYMPAEMIGLDQEIFLTASAIAVNIVSFVGLYFVLKKILKYFSIEAGSFFNLSMLWLAAVAGSVFWIQFTNSRNLELLAGLLLLYVGLLLYRKMSRLAVLLFLVVASLTYFSDPLQLFITSTVLAVYVILNSFFFQKEKRKEPLVILFLIVLGYLVARVLILTTQEISGTQFIAVSARPHLQEIVTNLPTVGIETAKNTIRLLAGTNEMGVWRQGLSMLIVGIFSVLSIMTLMTNKMCLKQRSFVLFVALMLAVPVAVYVASGQPLFISDTSRYLIVLVPALIMLFSVIDLDVLSEKTKRVSVIGLGLLLFINIGALFLVTLQQGDKDYLAVSHLEERYSYLERNSYSYGYASMDTAIPSMYLLSKDKGNVLLPLSCEEGGSLRKATLFYDKNVFMRSEKSDVAVPIIMDGNAITNHPNVCSEVDIKKQLGEPIKIESDGVNTILVYDSSQLIKLNF